jgi:taurine--2-oxoglutarate transaminase
MTHPFFFTWTAQQNAVPQAIVGGEGARFRTADGASWLDMASLSYQANLGHGNARIAAAIKGQVDELLLTTPSGIYPAKTALAEKLLAHAPPGFTKVFFTLGGAEAIENALKIARLATGRHKLLARYRSYHGASMGALSLSGDFRRPPLEPGLAGVVHVLDCYESRLPGGARIVEGGGSAEAIARTLELEGARSIAAVFAEPVPGANGVLVPPRGYWDAVRAACDAHGTLLVADCVLNGFGRLGTFYGFEAIGSAAPDLITISKGLTGGYAPLGAVLVHERVARHFEENVLYAGLTFYGHRSVWPRRSRRSRSTKTTTSSSEPRVSASRSPHGSTPSRIDTLRSFRGRGRSACSRPSSWRSMTDSGRTSSGSCPRAT